VTVRSYSRISGSTSEESDTGTPGSTSAAISPIRRSCAGSAKELISETASASTPTSFASWARTSASSSGRITRPSDAMRWSTSTVFSSAASGSGFGQMIQPASPPGTNERAICRTCRKPFVVTSPTVAPLPSRIALVATVVPCSTWATSESAMPASAHTLPMPLRTPTDWSEGVEAVFARQVAPVASSTSSTSVNVPPTSTPSR
jgi:hypothetical protein